MTGGYRIDRWGDKESSLAGGELGGVSGFSDGVGPGGHTGRCLFGMGIGKADDELMESRLSVGVKGCEWGGEEDLVCPAGMGLGRAIVAMIELKQSCNLGMAKYCLWSRCNM